MATASSSLHQPIFPQYPSLSRNSRFHPPLRFSSLRFTSRIRASSAVALEPVFSSLLIWLLRKALTCLNFSVSLKV